MEGDLKQARHAVRGRLNSLKLCISALDMLKTRAEKLEFLAMIDQSADRTIAAMDAFEKVWDRESRPSPPS
jgi:hypothetical protein